jgi:ribonuclease I
MQAVYLVFALVLICALAALGSQPEEWVEGKTMVNSNATSACAMTSYVFALQHSCGFESIHGLWPDPESACTYCSTEAFSTSKLSSSTLDGMKKYWPTCQSGNTNEDFWSHEWSKHGTCTGMTQNAYFSKGLSLFSTYSSKCTTDCYLCFTASLSYQGKC